MVFRQKTIKKEIFIDGIGVHTGEQSSVYLQPADENHGIIIKNKCFPDELIKIGTIVPEQAMHATVLKSYHWSISTIEHLMATLYAFEIDNLLIIVNGSEVPILDGSALPFTQAIKNVGIIEQNTQKKFITPKQTLFFEHGERFLQLTPSHPNQRYLLFDYSSEFKHPLFNNYYDHHFKGTIDSTFFTEEIAPARTFGFLHQLPFLRKNKLAQGTSLGNTVVVGEELFLNDVRFENEPIRHKLLDLIGDLTLLGKNLIGSITARNTGHNFNRSVIEHFIANPDSWEII